MSAGDYSKTLTDFWSAQGKAMLEAQEKAARTMTEGMQAMLSGHLPSVPGTAATDLGAATAELGQASDAMMQLWSAATAMSGELSRELGKYVGGDREAAAARAVFERIADPRQWMAGSGELDEVLGRMAEGPRLADLWDLERRYARVMRAWTQLRRRALEHNKLTLDAWMRAGRRFMEELAGRTSADGGPLEPKQAFALWTETANRELLATQRSEQFLQSQRELIRASTELRIAQGELVEHFGKQYGFPTRTELDDVHRTLTEMRRELRRMRRSVQAAPASAPEPPPLPAEAPATVADASPRGTKRKGTR
jgi:poly[(R)-3-hydroxyalkanoate] polymerase subunit PhaE